MIIFVYFCLELLMMFVKEPSFISVLKSETNGNFPEKKY